MLALRGLANAFKFERLRSVVTPFLLQETLPLVEIQLESYCQHSDAFLLSLSALLLNIGHSLSRSDTSNRIRLADVTLRFLHRLSQSNRARTALLAESYLKILVTLGTIFLSAQVSASLSPRIPDIILKVKEVNETWNNSPDLSSQLALVSHELIQLLSNIDSNPVQVPQSSTETSLTRCEICSQIFQSNAEMINHAKKTGHTDFGQVSV